MTTRSGSDREIGRPRRARLFDPANGNADVRTLAGLGGNDLEPAAGSPAARYEEQVRAHPNRYAVIKTASGDRDGCVVPIVLASLVARWAFPPPLPDWNLSDPHGRISRTFRFPICHSPGGCAAF